MHYVHTFTHGKSRSPSFCFFSCDVRFSIDARNWSISARVGPGEGEVVVVVGLVVVDDDAGATIGMARDLGLVSVVGVRVVALLLVLFIVANGGDGVVAIGGFLGTIALSSLFFSSSSSSSS